MSADARLSRSGGESCAACHPLDRGGVDRAPRAPSATQAKILRNTPTVFNSGINLAMNWHGSARSLEAQAEGVITQPGHAERAFRPLPARRARRDHRARAGGLRHVQGPRLRRLPPGHERWWQPGPEVRRVPRHQARRRADEAPDLGRDSVTHDDRDREVFRVPSLCNVAPTAPYFHDGRAETLEDAVRTMARVQLYRSLNTHESEAIVAFLGTLTGEW